MSEPDVRLVDVPGEQGRTTVTLLASLTARLATLPLASGSDVIGSIAAGYAALGRAVARSAEGAQMRRAIETSVAGANGDAIWQRLHLDEWLGSLPPAPVLQQLQNDIALLAADDLGRVLDLPAAPAEPVGVAGAARPEDATFADFLTGMWALSRLVVTGVEHLAASGQQHPDGVPDGATAPGDRSGAILR
ncbi:hypothetical protein [Actinoplanes sp. GCM10030250]|uniref:hypothetical protein n=1 Tax=Actinoplanes sp. GCM10030250 TaxID=3273376 RepID=UPI0036125C05